MAVLLLLPGAGAWAGGVGDGGLRMTVTVNGRADSGTPAAAVRVGAQIVKRYRLVNRSEAHLYGVRVVDPGVPGGSVPCPRRPLAALGEMECVARFPALPGARLATARAEGDVPSLGLRMHATARSGYTGVAGGLALAERVSVGAGGAGRAGRAVGVAPAGTATVTYTVTNRGNRPVHAVRVEDPALRLGPGAVNCDGTVALLAPGASARCTATVRRPPGTHRSTGLATGSDRVATYDAGGRLAPAPTLTARSSATFTIASPRAAAGGAGAGSGGAGGVGGAVGVGGAAAGAVGGGAAGVGGVVGAGGAGGAAGVAGAAGSAGVAGAAGASGAASAAGTAGAASAAGAAGATGAAGAAGAAPGAPGLPGTAPQAPAPPGGIPPGGIPPAAVPPAPSRAAGASTAPAPARVAPPRAVPDVAGVSEAVPRTTTSAARDDEGFLGRLRRRAREAHEFGVVAMLLLLLIPAAIAAALLGNRGH